MYPSLSDRYVWFWNQLAQRLGNKCPGRYIDGTMVHESLYDAAKAPDLWKEPRLVDLTPHLRFGTAQTLAVRVHDSAGSGYVAVSFNPV
jgi:hypothetical protein